MSEETWFIRYLAKKRLILRNGLTICLLNETTFYIAVISMECIPHRKSLDFLQRPE